MSVAAGVSVTVGWSTAARAAHVVVDAVAPAPRVDPAPPAHEQRSSSGSPGSTPTLFDHVFDCVGASFKGHLRIRRRRAAGLSSTPKDRWSCGEF
jgi:hypothetical protein